MTRLQSNEGIAPLELADDNGDLEVWLKEIRESRRDVRETSS